MSTDQEPVSGHLDLLTGLTSRLAWLSLLPTTFPYLPHHYTLRAPSTCNPFLPSLSPPHSIPPKQLSHLPCHLHFQSQYPILGPPTRTLAIHPCLVSLTTFVYPNNCGSNLTQKIWFVLPSIHPKMEFKKWFSEYRHIPPLVPH